MPEQDFEQQARDMANGFEMEPKPEVWQNVRTAIQQPRRKRRVLLWWLLPLTLLCGSIAFYTFTKTGNATGIADNDTLHTNTHQQTIETPAPQQQQAESEKEVNKKRSSTFVPLSKNIPLHQQQSAEATNRETQSRIVIEDGNKQIVIDETIAGANTIKDKSDVAKDAVSVDSTSTSSILPVDDSNKNKNNDLETVKNTPAAQQEDSLHSSSVTKDSSISSVVIHPNASATDMSVSSNINKTIPSLTNIPDSSNSTKPALVKAKQAKQKLHWGILAEGGIAARKSSVFSFANMEKSLNDPQNSPGTNGSGSMVTGLPGSNSGYYYSNNIKQGAALGLGVALQKKVSRSIDLFADVAYHYQSFKTATTVYKDSLVLNLAFATLAGSYQAAQSFHFAGLHAGIQWHFINTKHIQLGISAGADNLLLLAAKQNINGVAGNNFSFSVASRISSYAVATNNFYTYQPGLFAGVLFNLKTGKQQLQVEPFTRSSFRPFERNTTSTSNHLFSAGLRAVYFFK